LERRILGAPLQFLYADNTEPSVDSLASLPPAESPSDTYRVINSKRNADMLAIRFRAGRA